MRGPQTGAPWTSRASIADHARTSSRAEPPWCAPFGPPIPMPPLPPVGFASPRRASGRSTSSPPRTRSSSLSFSLPAPTRGELSRRWPLTQAALRTCFSPQGGFATSSRLPSALPSRLAIPATTPPARTRCGRSGPPSGQRPPAAQTSASPSGAARSTESLTPPASARCPAATTTRQSLRRSSLHCDAGRRPSLVAPNRFDLARPETSSNAAPPSVPLPNTMQQPNGPGRPPTAGGNRRSVWLPRPRWRRRMLWRRSELPSSRKRPLSELVTGDRAAPRDVREELPGRLLRLCRDAQVGLRRAIAREDLLGLVVRDGPGDDHVLPQLPVHRRRHAVLRRQLEGVDHPQYLVEVATGRHRVDEDQLHLLVGTDHEHVAHRLVVRGRARCGVARGAGGEHPVELGHVEVGIADDRVAGACALGLLDVVGPQLMLADGVDREPDDLHVAALEVGLYLGHVPELGGADRGEVLRVREQDRPRVADPVVELDAALRRLGLEVWGGVAQLKSHRRPPSMSLCGG